MATLQSLVLASSLGFHIFALAHPSPLDDLASPAPQLVGATSIGGVLSQPLPPLTSSLEPTPSTLTSIGISSQPSPTTVSIPQITTSPNVPSSPPAASESTPPSVSAAQEGQTKTPGPFGLTSHRQIGPEVAGTKTSLGDIFPVSAPASSQTASTDAATGSCCFDANPHRQEPATKTSVAGIFGTTVHNNVQETSAGMSDSITTSYCDACRAEYKTSADGVFPTSVKTSTHIAPSLILNVSNILDYVAMTKTRINAGGTSPTSTQSDRRAETKTLLVPTTINREPNAGATEPTDIPYNRTFHLKTMLPESKVTAQGLLPNSDTATNVIVGVSGQTDTPGSGVKTTEQSLFSPQTKTSVPIAAGAMTKTIVTIITTPLSAVVKTSVTDVTTFTVPIETLYAATKTQLTDQSDRFRPMYKTSTLNLENPADVAGFQLLPIPAGMTPPPTVATEAAQLPTGAIVLPVAGTYITAGGSSAVVSGTTYSLDVSARTAFVNGVASSVTPSQLAVMATTDGRTTMVPMTLTSPSSTPTTTQPTIAPSPTRSSTSTGNPLATGASAGRLSALGSSWLGLALLFAI